MKGFLYYLLVLPTLSLSFPLSAQVDLDHFALSVSDPSTSVIFYSQILGMNEIQNRTQKAGIRWLAIDEKTELHLISGVRGSIQTNKAVHLALHMKDFDRFINKLEEKKIPYSDWAGQNSTITHRADGVRQVYLQDPDGYWIEINGEP